MNVPGGSRLRSLLKAAFALSALLAAPEAASAACKIGAATLPVTMLGMRPLLPAKVNGQEALFLLDSGAFFSMMTPASASKYHLSLSAMPLGLSVTGVAGAAEAQVGTVSAFTLAGASVGRLQFVISGAELGEGAAGLIGQNILGAYDVDYDFAHGAVRLMNVKDCDRMSLAYWAGDKPVSVSPLEDLDFNQKTRHAYTAITINGVRLTAMLDTGAATSTISEAAARRAGVANRDPGVVSSGRISGIGPGTLPSWIGTFKSIQIGGEELKNMRVRFGGMQLDHTDVLLGADFFLSHHVLISNSQRQVYFTYNGGPVFSLDDKPREIWRDASGGSLKEVVADPQDAPGLARRGSASASRHDYESAIQDLTRAIELSPGEPDYVYERGRAYLGAQKPSLAMADFDQALRLKSDDTAVLIARAALKLSNQDRDGALKDLNAADQSAAKQDDLRLQLARLYMATDDLQAAIRQDDLWLQYHSDDAAMSGALNGRCWARALLGIELDKALADCNRALRLEPRTAAFFDSRGLVQLRRGEIDDAKADYDRALALNPKLAWSLYGRGIAKSRKGDSAGSTADISAAVALNPQLPSEIQKRGLSVSGASKPSG